MNEGRPHGFRAGLRELGHTIFRSGGQGAELGRPGGGLTLDASAELCLETRGVQSARSEGQQTLDPNSGSLWRGGLHIGHAGAELLGIESIGEPVEPVDKADVEVDEDRCLGRGAGGIVARGKIISTGRDIAVKVVKVQDKDKRAMLVNDVKCLLRLSHSNRCLIDCFGAYIDSATDCVHVVLELMDYGSLDDIKNKAGKVPPLQLPPILMQIVEGLNVLHSYNIVHRDVKSGNVVVNYQGAVKVTDFGIAKALDDNPTTMTFVGTSIYMSPERVAGDEEGYGFPADIWSLGMVTYELASGMYAYGDAPMSFSALFNKLCNDPEPRLPSDAHSPELCDFVVRCLQRAPADRFTGSQLLMHDFIQENEVGLEYDEIRGSLAAWLRELMPDVQPPAV